MTPPTFDYQAILKSKQNTEVTSLIAYQAQARGPFEAVMWHAGREEWIYAPAIAAGLLFDDTYLEKTTTIDRTTAEAMATEHLQSSLPSVETLEQMCAEGSRMGRDQGPPVTREV